MTWITLCLLCTKEQWKENSTCTVTNTALNASGKEPTTNAANAAHHLSV